MVITLKKQRSEKFYKAVGFYFCICSGLVAILVIAAVQLSLSKNSTENQLADLNEPAATQEADTANQQVAETDETTKSDDVDDLADNDETNLLENDIVDDLALNQEEDADANNQVKPSSEDTTEQTANAEENEDSVSVITKNKSTFDEEKGLLWPMNGDILMNYSGDQVVYFSTLGQYKCNPALMIKGDVGQEILCSYKGTITDISENEETGLTVTMDIGSGYQLIYGQLKDLSVKKGDSLLEGETIGYLAEPTKYFLEEGSHLYFQVNENEESVDPLLLLR